MLAAFLTLQGLVVLFIALHDWIPLGRLNDMRGLREADTPGKLAVVTVLSTLPFAVGLAASLRYAASGFPTWLSWELWASYGAASYGVLRTWWLPYLLGGDPVRAARYRVRFARTHAFLPMRNGIRPDTLHVCFHIVLAAAVILLVLLTFTGSGFVVRGAPSAP
jgi:ABC-type uncharacterized transport system permease subunit